MAQHNLLALKYFFLMKECLTESYRSLIEISLFQIEKGTHSIKALKTLFFILFLFCFYSVRIYGSQVSVHPESMRQDFVAFTDRPHVFKRCIAITACHKGTRGLCCMLEMQDMISLR